MRHGVAALAMMMAGPALADPPAVVRLPTTAPRAQAEYRLPPIALDGSRFFRINDPRSPLRSGYGGSMVDLFPFAGGDFHISGGPRLFGRAGRPRSTDPECLQLLPAFRGGPKLNRRFSPAVMIGYGRTVERGLALGSTSVWSWAESSRCRTASGGSTASDWKRSSVVPARAATTDWRG